MQANTSSSLVIMKIVFLTTLSIIMLKILKLGADYKALYLMRLTLRQWLVGRGETRDHFPQISTLILVLTSSPETNLIKHQLGQNKIETMQCAERCFESLYLIKESIWRRALESLNKDDPSSLYYIIEKLSQSINVYLLKLASCDLICIIMGWMSCRTAPSGAIRS